MMRRLVCLAVSATALLLPATAFASPVFMVSGHGWGHGVGMAQYGAYGYAQNGWTYDQILAHYYSGTTLGPSPVSKIRVLLASGRNTVTIASDAAFSVRDAHGTVVNLPAGSVAIGSDLTLTANGQARALASPLRFQPGKSPLRLDRLYRGSIVVTLGDGKLVAVNQVGLEKYLYGVVPGEMPAGWNVAALKAQAVAARSYALASRGSGGLFDVYADTRSQVYGGIAAEDARTTAAVDLTKGQVVLYNGKVAETFFSASSGGRTAAIQDSWPGADPVPYLVSVDDPYDTISPYHDWGPLTFTEDELRQKLGALLPADLQGLVVTANDSGRVESVTATGADGQTSEISGATMRAKLGLRSTWFTIDAVALQTSARRIVYGGRVSLRGVVHGTQSVRLERKPAGGDWTLLRVVAPGKNGSFRTDHKPLVTTSYRIRLKKFAGPAIQVLVAPEVTLRKDAASGTLIGDMRPDRGGMTVRIQRKGSAGWHEVATAVSRADGRFRVRLKLLPGAYRARVAPASGLAAGISPRIEIGGG